MSAEEPLGRGMSGIRNRRIAPSGELADEGGRHMGGDELLDRAV